MANPQPHRFTRISNELLEAMCRTALVGNRARIILWVIRNSYGWGRKWAPDPGPREMGRQMDIDHAHIIRTLNGLVRAGILKREPELGRICLIKDYEKWLSLGVDNSVDNERCQNGTGAKSAPIVVPKVHQSGAKMAPPIYKVVKEKKESKERHRAEGGAGDDIGLLLAEFKMTLERNTKEPATTFNRGAGAKGFKKLLAHFPRHEIQARFTAWFASTDGYVVQRSWRVEDFLSFFNRLKDGPIIGRKGDWRIPTPPPKPQYTPVECEHCNRSGFIHVRDEKGNGSVLACICKNGEAYGKGNVKWNGEKTMVVRGRTLTVA